MVARAQRPDPGRRLAGAALVALAFIGVGFAYWELRVVKPVRMPGRITAANADLFSAYLPVHDYAYRRGALLPLWNPHQLAGTPFRANANGILYPPNLVGMLVPTERALGLVSAFHVALAGMGTWWCARALGASPLAATLAAIAFMLSRHVTSALVHPSHLAGYAWLPLVALAAGALLERPGLRNATLLGGAAALLLLTGSSQMFVYAAYASAVGGVVWLLAGRAEGAPLRLGRLAPLVVLALLVSGGLAAVQILPTVELLPHAARQHVPLEAMQSLTPSFLLFGATLLATGGVVAYVPAALVDRVRRRWVWAIGVVLITTLLVGLGTWPCTGVFHALPLADRFRGPQRMLVIADLMVALLAAIGFDRVRDDGARRVRLLLAALGALLLVATSPLLRGLAGGATYAQTASLVVAVLAVALAASRVARVRSLLAVLTVALLVGGRFLSPANYLVTPQHHDPEFFAAPGFARFLRERGGHDRVMIVRRRESFFPLMAKAGTLYGLNVVDDYEPLAPRAYLEVRGALGVPSPSTPGAWTDFTPEERERRWRAYDLMSVRWAVVERGVDWPPPGWGRFRQVYADDQAVVYESTPSLPRAYLVEDAIVASDAADAVRKLSAPGFDLRRQVVVDAAPVWPANALAQEAAAGAELVHAGAEEVRLRVATPRPALLVLTDLHWPGWRVTVNGEIRSMIRANALFRAIAVEPGAHDVRFVYEPGPAHIGALVSAVTLVLVIAVLAPWPRRVRRDTG